MTAYNPITDAQIEPEAPLTAALMVQIRNNPIAIGERAAGTTVKPPAGHLFGLTLSNNVSDATNDIDIAAGEAASRDGARYIELAAALTKRLDAAWAVGTNQGGLDTGAIANATYHVWLIMRSDTLVVDALFSLSATAPTMPTNYDYKRRIGTIIRTSAAIKAFTQVGDRFYWTTGVLDVSASTASSRTLYALTAPPSTRAMIRAIMVGAADMVIQPTFETNSAVSTTVAPLKSLDGGKAMTATLEIELDGSSQIALRSFSAGETWRVLTLGWIDSRGRLA